MTAKQIPVEQQNVDTSHLFIWVKGLETKVNNLLREIDMLKNDFIKKNNNLRRDLKTINEDFLEIKHGQEKTAEKINLIIGELKRTAGREEVQILKKYMEYWNPLNFVTQRDLEKLVEIIRSGDNLSVGSYSTDGDKQNKHKSGNDKRKR